MAHFNVHLDYQTGARAGAHGTFQVISITDENNKDCTHLVDQGTHYHDLKELASDIANALGIKTKVHLTEV